MKKKAVALFSVLAVLFLVALGFLRSDFFEPKDSERNREVLNMPRETFFSPEVPDLIPASALPEASIKPKVTEFQGVKIPEAGIYELQVSARGFSPDMIAARKGSLLELNITAVDGDYDIDIPYLKTHILKTEEGETKTVPVSAGVVTGTFDFMCRNFCPKDKVIRGKLVVTEK